MKRWSRTGAVLALGISATGVVAQDRPDCLPRTLPAIAMLSTFEGTCRRAVHQGKDRTSECGSQVIAVGYLSGRSGFSFALGDGLTMLFTGGKDSKRGPAFRLEVDKLSVGVGVGQRLAKVRGSCTLDASEPDAATIACRIGGEGGDTVFDFVANGPPHVSHALPCG